MKKKFQMYASDDVLEEFYGAIASGDETRLRRVHIPRSDVFYVRVAVEEALGEKFSLDRIERAMLKEKMLEPQDCFEPDRVRDWEDQYRQFEEDYEK